MFFEGWYGMCAFHIMQNSIKHLPQQKDEDPNILSDFSACMFEYVDKEEFESEFKHG